MVGLAEPPIGADAAAGAAEARRRRLQLLRQRERAVHQRGPVLVELGSATDSVASPAVEITLAVVAAV